jgi:Na+-transporting NADH:ubiquinone oxidoreductase subunit D
MTTENKSIFGKQEKALLLDPFSSNNPVTVQILGVCSALAVTTQVIPSIVMAIAVTLVTAFSNLAVSMLRNRIPNQVRMIVQLVVIATLVTVVELILKAFAFEVWKSLSVFIGLIITNCILMGRLEAYAMANKPWQSFIDGIGNGLGYGAILLSVSILREFTGKGSIAGFQIIPQSAYEAGFLNNNLMVLPASALFVIGIIIWIQRSWDKKLVDIS